MTRSLSKLLVGLGFEPTKSSSKFYVLLITQCNSQCEVLQYSEMSLSDLLTMLDFIFCFINILGSTDVRNNKEIIICILDTAISHNSNHSIRTSEIQST